jgi:hypothetical protein
MASPGFLAGWQVGSQAATLVDADHITTTGRVEFYDVNRQLYRAACALAIGERFKCHRQGSRHSTRPAGMPPPGLAAR